MQQLSVYAAEEVFPSYAYPTKQNSYVSPSIGTFDLKIPKSHFTLVSLEWLLFKLMIDSVFTVDLH